jgi:cob(I)alamin adenosyltransferase
MRIDRVYTKAGDHGQTRLVGGRLIAKEDLRLESYGTIDELNSIVGLARVYCRKNSAPTAQEMDRLLTRIQHQLFDLGSELATHPEDVYPQMPLVQGKEIQEMEEFMDLWTAELPPLKSFILPGGGEISAFLHLARTTCRRAERIVVALSKKEPLRPEVLQYLNRLSDLFFVMVRKISKDLGESEELWIK